jgi:hypothetical protein
VGKSAEPVNIALDTLTRWQPEQHRADGVREARVTGCAARS